MNQRLLISLHWAGLLTWGLMRNFTIELLPSGEDMMFGGSAQHGIDPGKRVLWFGQTAGFLSIGLLGFCWMVGRLERAFVPRTEAMRTATWVSAFGLSAIVFDLMGLVDWQWVALLAFAGFLSLALAMMSGKSPVARCMMTPGVWALASVVVVWGLFATMLLFNSSDITARPWWLAWLWLTGFFGFMAWLKNAGKGGIRQISAALLPCAVVPLAGLVSVESLFFSLKSGGGPIRYKWLFLALTAFAVGLICLWQKRKRPRSNSTHLMVRWMVPSALLAFVLMYFGWPLVGESAEMFELANPANAQLRVFRFGEIPFVDFFTSHMFSEQYYGLLYHLIFGFEPTTEFLVYRFITEFLFFWMAFVLLHRVTRSLPFALGFLLCFPLVHVLFHYHLVYTAMACFAALSVAISPSPMHWAGLWTVLAALLVWRLDTGVAALMAIPFFIAFVHLTGGTKFSPGAFLRGTGLFAAVVGMLFLSAAALREFDSLTEHIRLILGYLGANREHGLPFLSHTPDHWFLIHHVLLPAASVVCLVWIFLAHRQTPKLDTERKKWHTIAAFFFLVSLTNFPRGLIRHGFPENSELFLAGTFFIALALFIGGFVRDKQQRLSVFGLSSVLIVLVLKFFPHENEVSFGGEVLAKNQLRHLDRHIAAHPEGSRWRVENHDHRQRMATFRDYAESRLKRHETFLDFSNHPMLYFYSERKVPGYFCQNLQNTTTNPMRRHLLAAAALETCPLVVYSSVPPGWYDSPDGVPNFLRHYLIAEHIHRHYEPRDTVAGFSVWGRKTDRGPMVYSELDYAHSARFAGAYVAAEQGIAVGPEHLLPETDERRNGGVWLRVTIRSEGEIKATYQMSDSTGKAMALADFKAIGGEHRYALRISAHPVWQADTPLMGSLRLHGPAELTEVLMIKENE